MAYKCNRLTHNDENKPLRFRHGLRAPSISTREYGELLVMCHSVSPDRASDGVWLQAAWPRKAG